MTLQEAIALVDKYQTWTPAYGESGGDKQHYFDNQEVNTALGLINQYAMSGGDVSGLPATVQQFTTPEYAQHRAKRSAQASGGKTFVDQLWSYITSPAVLTAAGGLAGVYAGGASAAAGAGTEAAGTYGAAGEFAGAGGTAAGAAGGTGLAGGAAGGTGLTAGAGGTGTTGMAATGTGALGSGISSGAGGVTGIGAGTAAGTAGTAGGTVAGAMPWANLAGTVLEYMGSREAGKTAEDLMRQQMESDQWRPQQGRYFEPLYQAATQGIGNTPYGQSIADATARKSSAMGYNMSGNQLSDIAQGLNTGSMDYVRALTPLATGRGESQAPGQFAPALMGAAQAPYGIAGYGLDQIIKNWPSGGSGNQPSSNLGSGSSFQNYQPTDYQNIFL